MNLLALLSPFYPVVGLLVLLVLMMIVAIGLLGTIINKLETIMPTLQEVLSDMTNETTVIESLSALISGLRKQVTDALSGATLPPTVQAQVDQAFALAEANKLALSAALVAGTPAAAVAPDAAGEPITTTVTPS